MFEFSSSQIGKEIMKEIDKLTPCYGDKCDRIYEGYIFEDIHPDNNPYVKYSEDDLITLNDLIVNCKVADYVKIFID
jgi:hypothetical protein